MSVKISKITVMNPSLFRHGEDLDKAVKDARFMVHDSMEECLAIGEAIWIKIAQLCSVMSVYWLQGKVGVPYKSLSAARQEEIATVVVGNNTPEDQFNWARDTLKYTEIKDKEAASKLVAGSKVLLYTPKHVSAAIIGKDGKWLTYDPETASAEEYSVKDVTTLYLDHSTKFLHGK
jgi:hypothetical protein